MRVHVKLFAILRERAGGVAEIELELPDGARVADAAAELLHRFPAFEPFLPRVAYAVNQSYAKPATILNNADELALIPPVSGG